MAPGGATRPTSLHEYFPIFCQVESTHYNPHTDTHFLEYETYDIGYTFSLILQIKK
jgi:hypothetical protein